MSIVLTNNKPRVRLTTEQADLAAWWSSQGGETWQHKYKYDLTLTHAISGSEVSGTSLDANCRKVHFVKNRLVTLESDYIPCAGSYAGINLEVPIQPEGTVTSGYNGRITNSCLWLNQNAIASGQDSQGNTYSQETEVVIYSNFYP